MPGKPAFPRLRPGRPRTAGAACHAGGRGFESRRSRLSKCLQIGTWRCLFRRSSRLVAQSRGPNTRRKIPANWHFPTELVSRSHKQDRVSGLLSASSLPGQTKPASASKPESDDFARPKSGTASRIQGIDQAVSLRRDSRKPQWPLSTGAIVLRRSLTGLLRAPWAMRRVLGAVGVRARAGEGVPQSAALRSFGYP
jgi:hypothetical protein